MVNKVFVIFVIIIIVAAIAIVLLDPSFLIQIGITNIVAGASAFVAILALTTSYFTFLLIEKQTSFIKRQTAILQKQALVSQKKENPILEFNNLKFVENKISFSVKNVGKDSAYWIGVRADYWPMKVIKWEGKDDLSIDDKGRNPYDFSTNKKLFSISYVNLLSHIHKKHIVLKPNQEMHFELEPRFGFKDKKDGQDRPGSISKNTSELVDMLSKNGAKYLDLRFSLLCKNLIEEAQLEVELDKFIFVLANQRHKSLEDAQKEHFQESFRQIHPYEFELTEGVSIDFYKLRSGLNENPYEETEQF